MHIAQRLRRGFALTAAPTLAATTLAALATALPAHAGSLYTGPGPRPGPDILYRPLAKAPQLTNGHGWRASPILISGTSAYRKGEFLYQDFLYDDHGANGRPGRDPEDDRIGDDDFSQPNGTYTYPTDDVYADNAADLVEFRVRAARRPHLLPPHLQHPQRPRHRGHHDRHRGRRGRSARTSRTAPTRRRPPTCSSPSTAHEADLIDADSGEEINPAPKVEVRRAPAPGGDQGLRSGLGPAPSQRPPGRRHRPVGHRDRRLPDPASRLALKTSRAAPATSPHPPRSSTSPSASRSRSPPQRTSRRSPTPPGGATASRARSSRTAAT